MPIVIDAVRTETAQHRRHNVLKVKKKKKKNVLP